MVEMIQDGRTGWLAYEPTSSGLQKALRQALENPWTIISEMGREAARDIRRICDNRKILAAQLEFRGRLADKGANRSLLLPESLTLSKHELVGLDNRNSDRKDLQSGIGFVATAGGGWRSLGRCMDGIAGQSRKPAAVAIVYNQWALIRSSLALRRARKAGWRLIKSGDFGLVGYRAWTEAIFSSGTEPTALVFLSSSNKLKPEFVATCEAILEGCPEIGIVSCWTTRYGRTWIRPCPCFPYQWLSNDAVPFSAVRVEALKEIFRLGYDEQSRQSFWELVNSVMAAGWKAVTIPEVLGDGYPCLRKLLYDRPYPGKGTFGIFPAKHPDLVSRESAAIQSFLRNESTTWWEILISERKEFESAAYALHHPIKTVMWLLRELRRRSKRFPGFVQK
jgi:hypothetical protein